MPNDESGEAPRSAHLEIEQLKHRLDELQARTNLLSPNFLTRAFAVLGHYLVAGLIVAVPLWVLIFIIALAAKTLIG